VPGATYTETTGVSANNVIGNSQPGTGHYSGFILYGSTMTTVRPSVNGYETKACSASGICVRASTQSRDRAERDGKFWGDGERFAGHRGGVLSAYFRRTFGVPSVRFEPNLLGHDKT
jgi:hypothetical protein